jgi:hypothetical protein
VTTPTAVPPTPARQWPDNPMWHHSQAAGHWMAPIPRPHRDDAVFGPCTCDNQEAT